MSLTLRGWKWVWGSLIESHFIIETISFSEIYLMFAFTYISCIFWRQLLNSINKYSRIKEMSVFYFYLHKLCFVKISQPFQTNALLSIMTCKPMRHWWPSSLLYRLNIISIIKILFLLAPISILRLVHLLFCL